MKASMSYLPYMVGALSLLILYIVYKATTGDSASRLYEGADGRPSTSKFQFFLWTIVVIFSYPALYTVKLLQNPPNFSPITSLPDNLLIAIGMSVVSVSAAKAITVSYVTTNRIAKSQVASGKGKFGDIFQDDSGVPDLGKVQIMAWTFIAIVSYLIAIGHNISTNNPELPNIDKSLMALMGLGHAAYLGKKVVTQDTSSPQVAATTRASGTTDNTRVTGGTGS